MKQIKYVFLLVALTDVIVLADYSGGQYYTELNTGSIQYSVWLGSVFLVNTKLNTEYKNN